MCILLQTQQLPIAHMLEHIACTTFCAKIQFEAGSLLHPVLQGLMTCWSEHIKAGAANAKG